MTIKQTIAAIKSVAPSLRCKWIAETKEYRIALPLDAIEAEDSAYYTNDGQDAIGTAQTMQKAWMKEYGVY